MTNLLYSGNYKKAKTQKMKNIIQQKTF